MQQSELGTSIHSLKVLRNTNHGGCLLTLEQRVFNLLFANVTFPVTQLPEVRALMFALLGILHNLLGTNLTLNGGFGVLIFFLLVFFFLSVESYFVRGGVRH